MFIDVFLMSKISNIITIISVFVSSASIFSIVCWVSTNFSRLSYQKQVCEKWEYLPKRGWKSETIVIISSTSILCIQTCSDLPFLTHLGAKHVKICYALWDSPRTVAMAPHHDYSTRPHHRHTCMLIFLSSCTPTNMFKPERGHPRQRALHTFQVSQDSRRYPTFL